VAAGEDQRKDMGSKAPVPSELKSKPVPIRWAQDVWAVEAFILGIPTTKHVADNAFKLIEKSLGKKGVIKEVGCSLTSNNNYYLYVHFDWPPEASDVIHALSGAFANLSLTSLDLLNPFSMKGRPKDMIAQKYADFALQQIRDNQQQFVRTCVSGRSFYKKDA